MSKITIMREDNIVVVDGLSLVIDCQKVPANVRVVQWNGNKGHLEFVKDKHGHHVSNETITSLGPYQSILDDFQKAKDALPPPLKHSNPRYGDPGKLNVIFDRSDGKQVGVPVDMPLFNRLLAEAGVEQVPQISYTHATWLDEAKQVLGVTMNGFNFRVHPDHKDQVLGELKQQNVEIEEPSDALKRLRSAKQ